jgi:hypothetical protein
MLKIAKWMKKGINEFFVFLKLHNLVKKKILMVKNVRKSGRILRTGARKMYANFVADQFETKHPNIAA